MMPDKLPALPQSWEPIFIEFAKENALKLSLQEAFEAVELFYQLVKSTADIH